MKILFLSHTPDNGVFKVGSHHLARELSKSSIAVAHVSTPRSFAHKMLGKNSSNQKGGEEYLDEFGTLHVIPNVVLPVQIFKAGRLLGDLIKRIEFDDADFVLVDQPLMAGYVENNRLHGKVIYRPTDTYNRNPAAARQARLASTADGVVATSGAVLQGLDLPHTTPRMVLENGVELSRFRAQEVAGPDASERAGMVYVGAIDYRFDWESLIAIAIANPDQQISLVGPVSRHRDQLPGNISLLGSVPYDEVPIHLSGARVGLIPLNATEVNQGRSPMKYYEYLASGLSVLATSTASLRERQSSQTFLFSNAEEAAKLSKRALSADAPNLRGIQEAAGQDWSTKAAVLLEFLESL
ncbi:hypothetical protein ACFVTE_09470 [Arthrobacter sp. NPDC058097]|uniref:hypothetical protein n=1 Tax=Arthrobacter sp. NPDC058097 TaxID=3346340 RepID=UPI0036DBA446